jgi:hypothetical protein
MYFRTHLAPKGVREKLQPADGKVTTATMPRGKWDFRESRTGCIPILRFLASLAANDATVGVGKYGSGAFECQEKRNALLPASQHAKCLNTLSIAPAWLP